MRAHYIVIGTGPVPASYSEWKRLSGSPSQILGGLIGLIGDISLHLVGEWWTVFPPLYLSSVAAQMRANPQDPVITFGYPPCPQCGKFDTEKDYCRCS